jgi:hypothetical protein
VNTQGTAIREEVWVQLLLLRRIELYLTRTGTRPTTFGRLVLKDPLLVAGLRRGRALRPETKARVTAFLDRAERRPKPKIGGRR